MIRPRAEPGARPAGLRQAASRAPIDHAAALLRRGRPGGDGSEAFTNVIVTIIAHLSWVAILGVVLAHILFGQEDYPLATRVLTAVPAVLFILEGRAYLRAPAGNLPFVMMTLFQFYVFFSFPVFFDQPFYDLTGPVHFTETTRIAAGFAVALGGLSIWAGARVGVHVGRDFRGFFLRSLPPPDLPRRWDDAFYVYAAVTVVTTVIATFLPTAIPTSLSLVVRNCLAFEFAMGLALACPPRKLGIRASQGFVALGVVIGLLHGMLDLIFRVGMEYLAGRWAIARRFSVRLVAVIAVFYVVLQPIKQRFRDQVWAQEANTGVAVGVSGRVTAWESSLSYYGDDSHPRDDREASAVERVSELGSVMHAIQVIPGQVDYLGGEGFLQILYQPIPRLLWPEKPTTRETGGQYAVIFGRQTQHGSESTSITLPILVEGYWNFGWVGVALVCAALGFWMGLSQQVFSGEHWALRATGFAQFTNITAVNSIVLIYGSVFQTVVGRMVACWGVYWLATLLSGRRSAHTTVVGLRAGGAR